MTSLKWFKNLDCTEMTISKYKSASAKELVHSLSIKEKSAIEEIINRINALPVDGDEMIKMGPKAKLMILDFTCKNQDATQIKIYDHKIKTPSTGFIAGKNLAEENLVEDLNALLSPELNQRIPKIKDFPVKFKPLVFIIPATNIHLSQRVDLP